MSTLITTSVLRQKARKRDVARIAKAPYDVQVIVFRETLADLDGYLDTSDLLKLTARSLNVIKEDVLEIIKGLRNVRMKIPPGYVKSLDGTLEELRLVRDALLVALTMFDANGQVNKGEVKRLLSEMRLARKQIEKALAQFEPG